MSSVGPRIEYTRAQVEKLSNLSERELQLDRQVQHDIENEFVAINNEFDDDDLSQNEYGDDDDNDDYLDDSFKNLPLGPDGTPIPFGYTSYKDYINNTIVKFAVT